MEDRESDRSLSGGNTSQTCRNLVILGRRTSLRLEDEIWASFKEIANSWGCSVHVLASRIYRQKKRGQSLASAIRVFVVLYYRDSAIKARREKSGQEQE